MMGRVFYHCATSTGHTLVNSVNSGFSKVFNLKFVITSGSGTVVEHSPYLPDVKGLSLAASASKTSWTGLLLCVCCLHAHNGTARFEKCKQLLEYQNLLLLSDIFCLKF
jgi:hypothetical protein